MKRTPVVLLASGVLVAAITGTALASGGDDDASPSASRSASSSATASSAPSAGAPAASPSGPTSWSSRPPSGSASGSPTEVPTTGDTAGPTGTAAPGTGVDSRRAGRIALAHVGGGTVTKVESEVEHGRAVWSVRIVKNGARYDVDVDRGSGEITRSRARSGDDGTADDHHRGGDDGNSGRHGRHHD